MMPTPGACGLDSGSSRRQPLTSVAELPASGPQQPPGGLDWSSGGMRGGSPVQGRIKPQNWRKGLSSHSPESPVAVRMAAFAAPGGLTGTLDCDRVWRPKPVIGSWGKTGLKF